MDAESRIFIAGHRGMVGSAIKRTLLNYGYNNLIMRTRQELELTDYRQVELFFAQEKPEYVFLAAARVGGILANYMYPAEFIYENLSIQANIIHNAYLNGVKKLLFLGSSCIYPRDALQPIKEDYLLTGKLEETNEAYAIAKIAGIKMCQSYNKQYGANYIAVMPTNLYGPGDNFDLETAHVLPALIRKYHQAKINKSPYIQIWGSGTPRREFLYVDDLAEACLYLMKEYHSSKIINIGVGKDLTINELAALVSEVVDYKGEIMRDLAKPDGPSQKLLDLTRINQLGWQAKTDILSGIELTYNWYVNHEA